MTDTITQTTPVLEPAAQEFVEATANPPFLFDLPVEQGRATVDSVQDGDIPAPAVDVEDLTIAGGPTGEVSIRVYRPAGSVGPLPVILFTHGAGWVFGDAHTHDRLVRELTTRAEAATVFTSYSLSPEARYPVAIEQVYAALEWIGEHGAEHDLDPGRIAVAGDSVGGNMTAAVTLMAKQRGGPRLAAQLLYYPVTDASFDTASYHQFATDYWLRRDAMQWFWDQYTTDPADRAQITASPLRASLEELSGLPRALVIVGEADVLRDEGEAYAAKLRAAGVPVTAVRYQGIVHDFVMVNALRETHAAVAATAQGGDFLQGGPLRRVSHCCNAFRPIPSPPGTHPGDTHECQPTVVLVHGAFADASSFAELVPLLVADGLTVRVPAVPNRSLVDDAAYIASVVRAVEGPVLLVGHSYGGAVITVAGVEQNVVGLVYLAGYALDQGESLGELQGRFPDSDLASALVYTPFPVPGSDEPGTDVSVDVSRFPAIFAADVDPDRAAVLAVSQRPLAAQAFGEPASAAAWRSTPAWGVVAAADHTLNPDVERFGYERAGMTVTEVDSSHLVMLAHPEAVAEVIRTAVAAVATVDSVAAVDAVAPVGS